MQFNQKIQLNIPGLDEVKIPPVVRVRQIYESDRILDLKDHLQRQIQSVFGSERIFEGKSIGITVGSRGIPSLHILVRTLVEELKRRGATPFILPAMGSHGGACVSGQVEILAGYGITEEEIGAPIRATMEVEQIGVLPDGTPVYCDAIAYASDGIVFLNKIKPHTDFRGAHESGLAKMMAIGIANHKGASMFHRMGFASFSSRIPEVCKVFLQNAPIAFGVGLVQNAYDEISELEVILPEQFLERDAALLEVAKRRIAKFKIPDLDVLVIDQIGKNISGNGHDPNITGRSNSPGFEQELRCQKLFIRGLTPETHFNGAGLNHADITLRRVVESLDLQATWTNVATVNILKAGAIPLFVDTDLEALKLCIRTCLGIDYSRPRMARILDTLHMNEIEVSVPYWEQLKGRSDVEQLSEPYEWKFDSEGNLV